MNSKTRREIAWLCLPLVLIIGVGAWISHDQSESNAEKRRRESGPLRVRVWGIYNMGVDGDVKAAGYNYGYRIDAHLEGQDSQKLKPGESWMLRVKSAQIIAGQTSKKARLVSVMSPVVYENGAKEVAPSSDVMEITEVNSKPREVNLWLYCDSSLMNPTLKLQVEVVAGKVAPVSSSLYKKKFVPSNRSLIVPSEKIPLRVWNPNDDSANAIKSTY